MVASMARSYIQFCLPRQFLMDSIWREQSINNILQTFCLSQAHYQCYRTSSILLKKRGYKEQKDIKILLKEQILKDPTIPLEEPKRRILPTVEIWDNMTVTELANSSKKAINDVIDCLWIKHKNMHFDENTVLTVPLAVEVIKACGARAKVIAPGKVKKESTYEDVKRLPPDKSQLVKRPPIVTVMGHVDHGKTTLLDALRHSDVVKSEFGGITQHIGAFNVTLKSGEQVTFLDTPGHAAFSSMRYRGAHVTDIVVLVVAADDGVKDQTLQSIEMAKDANVPIIVAINKIDKPNANIKNTQNELAKQGIIVEELGGDVQCIKISALKGINLEELTEAIVLQAEIMNLRGDPTGLVEGVIIECTNDVGRGKLVTALIQRGTLKKGCLLVSGLAWAKVRAMFNDSGRPTLEAKPSEAVQIIGWRALPDVGDEILEVENDRVLHNILKHREHQQNQALAMEHKIMAEKKEEKHLKEYKQFLKVKWLFGKDKSALKQLQQKRQEKNKEKEKGKEEDDLPTINVIIKGDVSGSVEALLDILDTYQSDKICRLNIVHYGVGPIIETDVQLAETFNAIIYGFNVNIHKKLENEIKQKGISLRFYNVVYKLFDDLKEEINNILPEVEVEEVIGEAKVQQKFEIKEGKKKVLVAGCRCVKGVLLKSELYNVIRNNEIIYKGKLTSMRHLKDEVSSIETNLECGLRFEDPTIQFQPGDTIVCYKLQTQRLTVDWDPGF
nr:translation initiation factor IF-2, mitochondrial [Osmia lignaria]XP_034177880.1 translation initiation factor IF-2, mitochondrial [Osmia lignaria]XP_034177881.1 translation initiation factor IF-2, mitochondrial [Osmia lignaria]